jgi:hypothetical protein
LGISTTRNARNYTPSNVSVNDFFVTNPTKLFTHFGSISLKFRGGRRLQLVVAIWHDTRR